MRWCMQLERCSHRRSRRPAARMDRSAERRRPRFDLTAGYSHEMALSAEKYIRVTTFKKDGTEVSTPTWVVALDDGKLGFYTSSTSGKAKRLKNNPKVVVQPSDGRGRPKPGTSPLNGTAVVVDWSGARRHLRQGGRQVRLHDQGDALPGEGWWRSSSASSSRTPTVAWWSRSRSDRGRQLGRQRPERTALARRTDRAKTCRSAGVGDRLWTLGEDADPGGGPDRVDELGHRRRRCPRPAPDGPRPDRRRRGSSSAPALGPCSGCEPVSAPATGRASSSRWTRSSAAARPERLPTPAATGTTRGRGSRHGTRRRR